MSSSDRPCLLASLLTTLALACATPPPSSAPYPSSSSSSSSSSVSSSSASSVSSSSSSASSSAANLPGWAPHAPSGATPERHPVPTTEPPCPGGERPLRFHACEVFHEESLVPGFEAPFETCKITLKGLAFSPAETARHRAQNPGSCCYLQSCQFSIGY